MTKLKKLAVIIASCAMLTSALVFNISAEVHECHSDETSISVAACSKHGYGAYKGTYNGRPAVLCGNCGGLMYYL